MPPELIREAWSTLPGPEKSILSFVLCCGCRPGEAVGLTWDQVDLPRKMCVLKAHKTAGATGKTRTIYLTPEAVAVLEATEHREGPVFRNRLGRRFWMGSLRSALRNRGIPNIYALRHSAAQGWLESGTPIDSVAKLLGHSDLTTVLNYAQTRDARALDAAASLVSPLKHPSEPAKPSRGEKVSQARSQGKKRPNQRKRAGGSAA